MPIPATRRLNQRLSHPNKAIIQRCIHPITLYSSPPLDGTIDISTFEETAIQRLQILHIIDQKCGLDLRSNALRNNEAARDELSEKLKEIDLSLSLSSTFTEEEKTRICRKDAISHFILRLAFSKDRERQEWFIRQESRLLLLRLEVLRKMNDEVVSRRSNTMMMDFADESEMSSPLNILLQQEEMKYDVMLKPPSHDEEGWRLWRTATSFRDQRENPIVQLFMIPFYPDASLLVRGRKVYIQKGIAFVPPEDIETVIISRFKTGLIESFKLLSSREMMMQRNVLNDPRIGSFVSAIPNAYLGPDFSGAAKDSEEDRLSPQDVNEVFKRSFPPCMRRLYTSLLKERHIKHWGRQQLWMFFKGAGMKLEEQLQFNRNLWDDPDKFDKEHRYNIRHMYGQEGKRANYTPYNCGKIIGGTLPTPGVGDSHGCPFKHFDPDPLKKLLFEYDVPARAVYAILELTKTNQHQLACVEYFKATHPNSTGDGIGNHPNAFYRESRRLIHRPSSSAGESSSSSSANEKMTMNEGEDAPEGR